MVSSRISQKDDVGRVTWKMAANSSIWAIDTLYHWKPETLSPQWPTWLPAPAKVLRVMTIGLLVGLRASMASRLAETSCAVEVVSVVHRQAVLVIEISINGLVGQTSGIVVDGVWWINQVSAGRPR